MEAAGDVTPRVGSGARQRYLEKKGILRVTWPPIEGSNPLRGIMRVKARDCARCDDDCGYMSFLILAATLSNSLCSGVS